jgi:hypothetical protein
MCSCGALRNNNHWNLLLRNWNLAFSLAISRYYNGAHSEYCFDGASYLAFFDTHFSKYLYYALGRADQHLIEDRPVNFVTTEFYRYDQVSDEIYSDYMDTLSFKLE